MFYVTVNGEKIALGETFDVLSAFADMAKSDADASQYAELYAVPQYYLTDADMDATTFEKAQAEARAFLTREKMTMRAKDALKALTLASVPVVEKRAAKVSKVDAEYVSARDNSTGQRCSGCVMYEMGSCDKVQGYIEAGAKCKYWMHGRRPGAKAPDPVAKPSVVATPRRAYDDGGQSEEDYGPDMGEERVAPADLVVVRHGQTEFNSGPEPRLRGQLNVPLDDDGKEQAEQAGQKLKDFPVKVIHCADLERTRDTADIICDQIGDPECIVVPHPELRTWNMGDLQGKVIDDDVVQQIKHYVENEDDVPPGGESFWSFKQRVLQFADRAAEGAIDGETTVLVTSARPIQIIELWILAGRDIDEMTRRFADELANEPDSVQPGGMLFLIRDDGEWRVDDKWRAQAPQAPTS